VFSLPSLDLLDKVINQPIDALKNIGQLGSSYMAVIALAALIVETDHTLTGDDINQSVLVTVPGRWDWRRHMPDDHLDLRAIVGNIAETSDQFGFHWYKLDRRPDRCQQCQQKATGRMKRPVAKPSPAPKKT
jgi:hypothetical protein